MGRIHWKPHQNRLARNSNPPGILAISYAYDDNDRLLSDVYDDNGNTRAASMTDPGSLLPQPVADQYDFENRLIDRNNGQIRVVYAGDGNLSATATWLYTIKRIVTKPDAPTIH